MCLLINSSKDQSPLRARIVLGTGVVQQMLFGGCFPSCEHLTFLFAFLEGFSAKCLFEAREVRGEQGWWEVRFPWEAHPAL